MFVYILADVYIWVMGKGSQHLVMLQASPDCSELTSGIAQGTLYSSREEMKIEAVVVACKASAWPPVLSPWLPPNKV